MTDPDVVEGDDNRCPHMMWAMWEEDADGDDAHIGFWRTGDGRIAIQSFQSNIDIRGRDMLDWMKRYGLPIEVVEAIPDAIAYWERMLGEGRIAGWEPATGWPSALERIAVPLN